MTDIIDRQAAIDVIDALAKKHFDHPVIMRNVKNAIEMLPSAQPDWNEIMVICDNCGHAIHAKREDCKVSAQQEATEKQVIEYCKKRNLVLITMESFETLKAYYDWRNT